MDAKSFPDAKRGEMVYVVQSVKKFAPLGSNKEKDDDGDTPEKLFNKEHAGLKKLEQEWYKRVANAYIIVTALIITITFAALITVPGGNAQGSDGVSRAA
ncbi:ankyrin repeat family protein [Tanacetum coccineum]